MFTHIHCRNLCLNIAVEKFDYDLIKYLIENGADANAQSEHGVTVLQTACKRGLNVETIEFLIRNGADIHSSLKQSFLESVPKERLGLTPLHFACRYGRLDIVKYLLSIGADANAVSDEGATPIFTAIRTLPYFSYAEQHKNDECIRTLRESGAYINHRDKFGWTPLDVAEKVKDTVSIDTLLSFGGVNGIIAPEQHRGQ